MLHYNGKGWAKYKVPFTNHIGVGGGCDSHPGPAGANGAIWVYGSAG